MIKKRRLLDLHLIVVRFQQNSVVIQHTTKTQMEQHKKTHDISKKLYSKSKKFKINGE